MKSILLIILLLICNSCYSQHIVNGQRFTSSTPVVVAQFNFGATGSTAVSDWTSVFGDPDAGVITVSDSRSGTAIGITTRAIAYWQSSGSAATTPATSGGESTANPTFYFPSGVVASYWLFTANPSTYTSGTNEGFQLTGLNPSKTYKIEILGSRDDANVSAESRIANYYCIDNTGSHSFSFDVKGNTANVVTFAAMVPLSDSTMKLHGVRDNVLNTFGAYWNGIKITQN